MSARQELELAGGLRGGRARLRAADARAVTRAIPRPFALVLAAAALCAFLTSCVYVHGVLQREVAAESAFVNAAVRRTGFAEVFHGRQAGAQALLLAALRRPDVREAHAISTSGTVVASDDKGLSGARLSGDALLERALRGEGAARTGQWRWATPLPLAHLVEARPPSLEFVVPVFDDSGHSVIGAVAITRAPGPAFAAASTIVGTIWGAYLVVTAVLYAVLHALLGSGAIRERWARAWGHRTDPRQAWLEVESDLRTRAAFRHVAVRGCMDAALPQLAVDPGLLGVVLRAFAAHALEATSNGDLLLVHVCAVTRGVEFAYSIPGAERADFVSQMQSSRLTAALARAVDDAGGALAILNESERGPRVMVRLPS